MLSKKLWSRALRIAFSATVLAGLASCTVDSNFSEKNGAASQSELPEIAHTSRSTLTANGLDKTGVMLQGFTWSSSSSAANWYSTVSSKASEIKNTFSYVWFPPASVSASINGYLPTQLNNLNSAYGSESALRTAISDIKPAKAIADIVINHRCGTTDWGDFTNPSWNDNFYSICSDDEGFWNSAAMQASSKRGNPDTGDGYGSGRDLDHTNYDVQNGIISWMNNVMKNVGFVGWRYDFVKGYSGYYVGKYDYATNAEFSVGEYWPTDGFNPSNTSSWSNQMQNWVNDTASGGWKSRVFDFVLKGNLNYAFGYEGNTGLWDMSRLADANNMFRCMPDYAVTFIDNHDTGSTQRIWAIDESDIAPAYAFILTHPGYPCVAWQHYFTGNESQFIAGKSVSGTGYNLRQHIDALISIRKECGICYDSKIEVLQASTYLYVAKIQGDKNTIIVKIGGQDYTPDSSYTSVYSGTNFGVWKQTGSSSSSGSSTSTAATYKLVAKVDPGYGSAVFFTGAFNEGNSWQTAIRGTYDSSVGGWYANVTGSNFEWKYMTGDYSLGSSVSTSTSGLTWQTGNNYTIADATLISSGSSSSSGSSGSSSSGSSQTQTKTVKLSATYDTGNGNAVYFTGSFDEGKSWQTAVRGTWTSGNVWTATVTVTGSSFEWKALKGSYSLGATTSVSGLTWESGSNHNQNSTSVTPSF